MQRWTLDRHHSFSRVPLNHPLFLSSPFIMLEGGNAENASTAAENKNTNTSANNEKTKAKERGREVTRETEKEKEKEKEREKEREKDHSPSPNPSSTSTTKTSSKPVTSSLSKLKKEKESKKKIPISDNSVTQDSTGGLSSASTPRPTSTPRIIPTLLPSPNALLFVDPLFDALPWEGLNLLEQYFGGEEESFYYSSSRWLSCDAAAASFLYINSS